jgi:hypothetical protein
MRGPEWLTARERVATLSSVLARPISIREVSAADHAAALARHRREPIARQIVAILNAASQAVSDRPDPTWVGPTRYRDWAIRNTAAFIGPDGHTR